MRTLAGTGPLVRLILRRDRVVMPLWVLWFGILPVITAQAFEGLYPTAAEAELAARQVGSNPAFRALFGPVFSPTIGGLIAWRLSILFVILGVVSLLVVIRHTRVEEETGRRELIGSTPVGRHAPLTAALVTVIGADLVVGGIAAGGLIAIGQPATGSVALGAAFAAAGALFAAVGAVAAQLAAGSGAARGIALAVLGLSFVLRAAGDAGGGDASAWPSWLSPLGWVMQLRAFGDERWWVLGLVVVVVMAGVAAAFRLASSRDIGAGILPQRLGPAAAARSLSSPLALAWRLHRGPIFGWAAAFAVLGVIYGSVAEGVGDLLIDNPELAEIFERLGGTRAIIDGYFTGIAGVFGLIVTGYAIQAASRVRREEEAMLAEPVLATTVTRSSWLMSHLVFALIGPAAALATGGIAAGAAYGAVAGDAGQVPRVAAAALVQLPAVWTLVGLTILLFGVLPQMTQMVWGAFGAIVLVTLLGQILQLSQWIMDVSPFIHVPKLPGGDLEVVPIVVLVGIAAVLTAAGFLGFRRRDVVG